MSTSASAPAKTILFGEHAVVYGEPAIAIPLTATRTFATMTHSGKDFRLISRKVGLDTDFEHMEANSGIRQLFELLLEEFKLTKLPDDTLEIRSDIPIASGLGSGAAFSAAVTRVFAKRFGKDLSAEVINRIVYETEKVYHGTPSGIDNTVITYEQPIFFIRGESFTPLNADLSGLPLIVADSGIRSRTVDVVSDVRANYERNAAAIHEIGNLVRDAREALKQGDLLQIGRLMNENQRLLRAIDVSCPELDELITAALEHGAAGAKLTGAGRGGNLIVLAQNKDHADKLRALYAEWGIRTI